MGGSGWCLVLVLVFTQLVHVHVSAQNLVVAGGALADDSRVFDKFVELCGGPSGVRIGVVTAASSDPQDSADYYTELFLAMGVEEVYWVPVHEGNKGANSDPQVVANCQRMDGFFFGGGDQARIINSFYNNGREESPVLAAIRQVYFSGGTIGGSSAGAVCHGSTVMIMGGYSWEALVYGAYRKDEDRPAYTLEYDPDGGIGLLDDYVVDSHYSERGREGRLLRLIADTKDDPHGAVYGVGLDEETAFVVTNAGTPQARGQFIGPDRHRPRGVMIYDISEATIDDSGQYWRIDNVIAHYLNEGDSINLVTHEITWDSNKQNIVGHESRNRAPSSNKIFDGDGGDYRSQPEFVMMATGLYDSVQDTTSQGSSSENGPRYMVTFSLEHPQAEAYFKDNGPGGNRVISYKNLVLSFSV